MENKYNENVCKDKVALLTETLIVTTVINGITFVCGSLFVKSGIYYIALILFFFFFINHLFLVWKVFDFLEFLQKKENASTEEDTRLIEFPEAIENSYPEDHFNEENPDKEKCEKQNKEDEEIDYEDKIVSFTKGKILAETERNEGNALFIKGILEEFDLYEYCRKLCDEATSKINLIYRTDDETFKIYSDKSAFKLIFMNILDNEIKYLKPENKLQVTMSKDSEKLLIIFRDDGAGVFENNPERLLGLNHQGRNKKSGTGLGLAQVKAVVSEWNGKVWIKSAEDAGFALYIEVPYNQYYRGGMR